MQLLPHRTEQYGALAKLLLPDISEFQWFADLPGIKRQNGGAVILRMHNGYRNDFVGVSHRAAAQKAGFRFTGLYQYVVHDRDAVQQAEDFCALVVRLAPGEFAYMDLEEGDGDQYPRAMAWLTTVQRLLNVPENRTWLYSGDDFADTHGLVPIFNGPIHTAVANYNWGGEPRDLGHTLWQSTDGAIGENITNWAGCGNCDTNVFHGNLDQLAALVGNRPAPPPPVPVPPPPSPSGKDILDMSQYLRLSRKAGSGPMALPPDVWTAIRFDQQDEPVDPQGKRGSWRMIVGTPAGARPLAWYVMGDAVVTLSAPVTKLELQAVAATNAGVRPVSPPVAFSGQSPVLEHQLTIHADIGPGESLFLLVRPSEETGTDAVFSGFVSQR